MNHVFTIEKLTTGYEGTRIIEELSLMIPAGKVTTIIGPNGCGKSTLLKTIGRILKQERGDIYLQDENMRQLSTKEIAKRLAMLAQTSNAPGQLKVQELVAYGRYPHRQNVGRLTAHDREKIDWALQVTQTSDFREREIDTLSGGQRQRVFLAMALAQETDILLLDEPTTYLDMAHQMEVLEIVAHLNKEIGCTVVMVLHDLNHAARFSDEMIAMKKGEIINSGTPLQMMQKEVLQKVFEIDAKIVMDEDIPVCLSYQLMK